jgi:hypothetical protein
MKDSQPFTGIPGRDATASIKGYIYQIYQSTYTWLQLDSKDLLILEGAEDFDVHNGLSVEATQVKHQSKNVTLKSKSVLDAIQNFWIHKHKNQDFNVTFRFLTTAEAGFEQGVKFDPNVTGLEYWVLVSEGKSDSKPLRDLLSSEISNVDLKDFLKNASDSQFCEELLSKIKWDLGSRNMEALQTLIENKLKTHGDKVGVSLTASVRVLPHLLKYVADLLTTKTKKSLWYADFLTEFERATTELVPRGTLEALQNAIVMQQLTSGSSFHATLSTFSPPIPLVQGALNRDGLVDSVKLKLSTCKVLFLHGSSGVGKTNLAAMCTHSMGGSWLWASFRAKPIEQLQQILVRAVDELERLSQPVNLVLDDLELDQISVFERELIALIFAVSHTKGYVLITSINNPPLHLFPKLWLPNDAEKLVPYFDEAEVSELIHLSGLNDLEQRKGWARVIFLMTSGHPQLVHARVRTLCAKGWPAVTYSEFLDRCDDIERVRTEARQRLLQEFPNEATRVLAYRLSLIIGGFSRKLALAVAFAAPKVSQMAGEAFDNLVGPWIEMEASDRFRVSPLLKGAAESNLSQNEINSIHTAIARNYLSRSTLDQFDVGTAFYHAFFAKDVTSLLKLANGILVQETARMSLLYEAMSWFSYVAVDGMKRIFPEDPALDLFLRLAQFKLALGSPVKDNAQRIIPFIEAALNEISDPNLNIVNRLLGYGVILNTYEVYIEPSEVVRMLSIIMDAAHAPELSDLYDGFKVNRELQALKVADNRPEQLLFSLQAARIRDVDDLVSLILALEKLPKAKRDVLLAVCESEKDFSNILIAQAWWRESQSQKLDTKKAINKLREIECKVREWNAKKLTIACLVAISVIHDEYEHDYKSAIEVLDNGEKEFVNSAFLLNQRAKVLFNADHSLEALSVAEQALGCSDLPDVEYIFTCRNAAIAASKLQAFEKSANFFLLGADRALVSEFLKPIGVGLLADSAYEYWLSGDKLNSISQLVKALKYLDEIPITENIKIHHLHATVRHCVSWIHFQVIDKKITI